MYDTNILITFQIPGYQYVSPEGNCVEHVQTSSAFIQVTFYLQENKGNIFESHFQTYI